MTKWIWQTLVLLIAFATVSRADDGESNNKQVYCEGTFHKMEFIARINAKICAKETCRQKGGDPIWGSTSTVVCWHSQPGYKCAAAVTCKGL